MRNKLIFSLIILLVVAMPVCLAGNGNDNALAAVALYIDTSGHYIPGVDMLNKGLNEVIRFKVNALFLGSEVQSGNEVLRELKRCNVNSAADAVPDALQAYSQARHVNYVLLFSVRPLDVALDIKAYSSGTNSYIMDKSVSRPEGGESISTFDSLTAMVGDEVTQLLQFIKG